MNFPTTSEEITLEWLKQIFQNTEYKDKEIKNFQVNVLGQEENGEASNSFRMKVNN